MALPIKKIYIDSRFRTKDSISSSNFKIELPESLLFPNNSVFYIDDVCIPHTFYSIEEGINDKLYMMLSPLEPDQDNNGVFYRIIQISPGNYNIADLSAELQTRIKAATDNANQTNIFTVSYDLRKSTIKIATNFVETKFKIMRPDDIATKLNGTWLGSNYDVNNPLDCNEIFNLLDGTSPFYDFANPFISNSINLQPIRNLYIHSPNLGNYNTIGPRGEATIIKKVPVSANYNEVIFDNITNPSEFLDCSRQSLKTIQFYILDSRGNYIPFHGANVSFSIVFAIADINS
jgi:hypothetical protein